MVKPPIRRLRFTNFPSGRGFETVSAYPHDAWALDFLTTHLEGAGKFSLAVSSRLLSVKIGPQQWESMIREFEQADRVHPPAKGAVLLVGGSNARRWTDVSAYFPAKTVINRGFGGASLADLLHFADRMVLPYAPSVIIVNAAANDLKTGTPTMARDACRAFVTKVRTALPDTRIYQMSIPPLVSALRVPERMERFREANRLLRALAEEILGARKRARAGVASTPRGSLRAAIAVLETGRDDLGFWAVRRKSSKQRRRKCTLACPGPMSDSMCVSAKRIPTHWRG